MVKKKIAVVNYIVSTFSILSGALITLLLIPTYTSKYSTVSADINAIPTPVVPCLESEVRNPEFHSMRPYQASPCGDSPKTYFCNNDYQIEEDVSMRWDPSRCKQEGNFFICIPEANDVVGTKDDGRPIPGYIIGGADGKDYSIALGDVKFPIVGNTENVFNSQSSNEQMSGAARMNEYVNWYLQGTTEKAEYGNRNLRMDSNIDTYSGPTKKLLPLDFLNFRRLGVLHDAGVHGNPYYSIDPGEYQGGPDDPTNDGIDPETGNLMIDATGAHPQIAVCSVGGTAFPCYAGNGTRAVGSKHRLITWWEGRGSTPSQTFFEWTDTSTWSGLTPPFPWQFTKEIYYRKSYMEWRGATCAIVDGKLYCASTGVIGAVITRDACLAFTNAVCSAIPGLGPLCIQAIGVQLNLACQQGVVSYASIYKVNREAACNALFEDYGRISSIPIVGPGLQLLCVDLFDRILSINPATSWVANIWADMYKFVPLGNPSDKNAKHQVGGIRADAPKLTIARVIDYDIVKEPVLHYPHTQSTVEVANLLNQTHTPIECDEDMEECNKIKGLGNNVEPLSCEFVDIRSNPGDSMTFADGNVRSVLLADNVRTLVEQIQCDNSGELDTFTSPAGPDGCGNQTWDVCATVKCNPELCGFACGSLPGSCTSWPTCEAKVMVTIRTSPKIPFAKQLWQRTVADKTSPFRRIFPKIEEGAPVSCIDDIPGRSAVTYASGDETNLVRIQTAGPNSYPGAGENSTSVGELFYPHQGTIYEYFLKGIQTALRPKNFGSPIVNGDLCQNKLCGQLPETFPPVSAACAVRSPSVGGANLPNAFIQILESAAETYNAPAQLILGLLYGEGVFNGGTYHGTGAAWDETNVTNWATCEPLPQCTGPENSLIGFNPGGFEDAVRTYNVLAELQKIDPTKTTVDPCNLLDVTYVLAAMVNSFAGGNKAPGGISGQSCFGITMGSYAPASCEDWYGPNSDSMFETAIRGWELGTWYDPASNSSFVCPYGPGKCNCATISNGCSLGGANAGCDQTGDNCEQIGSGPGTSHNACVWDVAHGK